MPNKNKHYYRQQNTVRFSDNELDYIDENYEFIADTTEKIPIKDFVLKAVAGAVTRIKPKEVIKEVVKEVESKETLQELEELKKQVNSLIAEKIALKQQIPPASAIVLNFNKVWRKYIWGVLQVSKKMNFAQSYEELIQKVFTVVNKRNELVLSEKDYEYLDTLDYPFEEPENVETKSDNEND